MYVYFISNKALTPQGH